MKQNKSNKRINSKKGPALPQDPFRAYKRGYNEGWSDGIFDVMNVVIYTLVDNEFLTDDEVNQFADRFKSVLDAIDKGNIKMADVQRVLKKEYDWSVNMR